METHANYRPVDLVMRIVSLLLTIAIMISTLTACDISSKHVEVEYGENDNDSIVGWDDLDDDNIIDWDNATITTWDEVDEYTNWVYSQILFENITDQCPIVDCVVLDYKTNGQYFDGEVVYRLVGNKFDANSFVAKYAVGTGVIVICVILTVATAGGSTPIACFIAGAADGAVSYATKGAAFSAATQAISEVLRGGDITDALYGALEGSADGYMWGAIYGAITGGFESTYCFEGNTLVRTSLGVRPICKISVGDLVYAYDEEADSFAYQIVSQVNVNYTDVTIELQIDDEAISSTISHPYFTDRGWVNASDIEVGDKLLSAEGNYCTVTGIDIICHEEPIAVYNLCVENYSTFVVGDSGVVVHNRCNPNEKYADSTRKFDEGTDLANKYPDGVYIKPNGYPDFSPYAQKTVTFDPPTTAGVNAGTSLRGDCYYDFKMANNAAGFGNSANATPKGWTWHHKEDGITMELIPTDLHRAIGHDGGEKVIKLLLSLV